MIHFRRKKGTPLPVAVLAAALTVSLSACGSAGGSASSQSSSAPEVSSAQTQAAETSEAQTSENAASDDAVPGDGTEDVSSSEGTAQEGGSSILIAYFTAAENSGVDAVASASYTEIDGEAIGRLRVIADMIQENVGGDLFSIHTSVVYPADGGELIDYAAREQSENARPELTTHIENLDQYDTIFIGYPNWWADLPRGAAFLMSMIFPERPSFPSTFITAAAFPAPSRPLRSWNRMRR